MSRTEQKLVIEDVDPSKEYDFKITAVNGALESKPLKGKLEGKTEYTPHESSPFPHDCDGSLLYKPLIHKPVVLNPSLVSS